MQKLDYQSPQKATRRRVAPVMYLVAFFLWLCGWIAIVLGALMVFGGLITRIVKRDEFGLYDLAGGAVLIAFGTFSYFVSHLVAGEELRRRWRN